METARLKGEKYVIIDQVKLHTRLYNNVLEGIKLGDELKRITENTNHLSWLAGSLVSVRYVMLNILNALKVEPYPELFSNNKGIIDGGSYPSLKEQKQQWEIVSDLLVKKITLEEEPLFEDSIINFPVEDKTNLGALIFLIDREAYVIGQMSLIRKAFGYEAMKYEQLN